LKETQVAAWKHKRQVMHRYNETAQMYEERYADEQKLKYEKTLENLTVKGNAVLDVGCGSGLFFNHIANQASLVAGVDVSRGLLIEANKKAKKLKNVFVVLADADFLPFPNGIFEDVFAFTILQNMPKPKQTLNELKRVAKPDGKLGVTALKKAFELQNFSNLLEAAGFYVVNFVDEKALKCYIAVLVSK
jgi:ubiquinone/menaquinone biosynthesis C-methylase UbiE